LPGVHYTIYFNGRSEYYDIHKTYPNNKHITLFKIKKVDADFIISRLKIAVPVLILQDFLKKKVRLSEMKKENFNVLPMNDKIKEDNVYKVINLRKFKLKSTIFDKKYFKKIISAKKIGYSKSQMFLMLDKKQKILGFVLSAASINPKEYFIVQRKNINEFFSHCLAVILYTIKTMDMEHKIKTRNTIMNFINEIKI